MQADIKGSTLPVLEIQLAAGESVITPHGELSWMTPNITMSQSLGGGGGQGGGQGGGFMGALGGGQGGGGIMGALGGGGQGGGGFMNALKRVAGGGGLFLTQYQAQNGPGMVAFASKVPGHIVPVDLEQGRAMHIHRHGWLASTPGINATVALQQTFRGGLFGGDGFLLQRLEGQGRAWIELSGELTKYQLQPGQTMLVHPGHVGMFDQSVQFTMTRIPGITNRIFGGDGFQLVALTGPGEIWLQSMPLPNLAHSLAQYLPHTGEAVEGGAIGGIVGSILRG